MGNRRLELSWSNKDMRLLSHDDVSYEWVQPSDWRVSEVRLLEHVADVGEEPEENLVIHGDALHALTSLTSIPELREQYLGRVKLCYIDPPFNTGLSFAHYDDAVEHSVWLTMLRDRLMQIHKLLSNEGSVWVHLDDVETHRARCVLDEVFGAENFVGTVIWEKADSPRNSAKWLSVDQDYIHVYAKDRGVWRPNKLPRTSESDAIYENPDSDPRGPWLPSDPFANKPYSLGTYELTGPTGRTFRPPHGKFWRISQTKLETLDRDGRVWWGPTGNARPSIKRYLSDVSDLVPRTLWRHSEVGSNRSSSNEMKALFEGVEAFSTPKPERLLQRVLQVGSDEGDIILDCFAGSGTTAAVAHKMRRRYVTVELSEGTVNGFLVPRLTAVFRGEDEGGITTSATEVYDDDLPDGIEPAEVRKAAKLLTALQDNGVFSDVVGVDDDLVNAMAKAMRKVARVRKVTTRHWSGGGGFRVARVGPSMFEADEDGDLSLADWATGGELARAVCAQMRYAYAPDGPFAGTKGRSCLAVLDGMLTKGVAELLLSRLDDKQSLCVVAQALEPGVEHVMRSARPGSKARKMPRDLARAGILPSHVVVLGAAQGMGDA